MKRVVIEPTFEGWRGAARGLLHERVAPHDVVWDDGRADAVPPGLAEVWTPPAAPSPIALPRKFVEIAQRVSGHRDARRWELLYRVAYRLANEQRQLLDVAADDDVSRLHALDESLRRDVDAMPPAPTTSWRDLPELRDLPRMLSDSDARFGTMRELQRNAPTAAPYVPADGNLATLRAAAKKCEGCDLFRTATQTVFGEGPPDARIVVVGEQPGDSEDLEGRPFIGPAGALLDRALAAAGLDRDALYLTNAVKHFAFDQRGRRRIHRTPRTLEAAACRPWLDAELRAVDPALILCLGATAARQLLGASFRILTDHGRIVQTRDGRNVLATIHPSAVLRAEAEKAEEYFSMLVEDLRVARAAVAL